LLLFFSAAGARPQRGSGERAIDDSSDENEGLVSVTRRIQTRRIHSPDTDL
jgi:hypothetical protein